MHDSSWSTVDSLRTLIANPKLESVSDWELLRLCIETGQGDAARRRIEALLKTIAETPQPLNQEMLRDIRAVAVLARIPTADAHGILGILANGAESARLTEAAKAALPR